MLPTRTLLPQPGAVLAWLALLAVTALLGVLVELQFERVFRQQVGRNLHAVLDATRLGLENWSRAEAANVAGWASDGSVRRIARVLAATPAARRAAHPLALVLRQELDGVLAARGYVGYLLLDASGQVLTGSGTAPVPTTPFADPYLAALRAQGSAVSAPANDAAAPCGDGTPRLHAGARIADSDGQALGFLLFCIDPRRELLAYLHQVRPSVSGESYGINAAGRMVGSSRFEPALWRAGTLSAGTPSLLNLRVAVPADGSPTRAAAALAAHQSGEELDGYHDYRGVEVVGAWAWSKELGFGLVTEIDRAEAYGPLLWLRGAQLPLYGVFTLLLTLGLWVLRRSAVVAGRQQLCDDMLEFSPLGAIVADDLGKVSFANARVMEMLGTSRQIFFATPVRRWYQAPSASAAAIEEMRAGRPVRAAEFELKRADGSVFPVLLSRIPVGGEGARRFVIWIEDVSERRRVEAELQRAGAMARAASDMKSAFLANMSHEIRTPINAVLNLTRLVLDGDALAPRQRDFLEKSLTAAEGLLALVNDVLDLSKIEAGRLDLELQTFQLPRVFAQVTSVLGERARQKGLALGVAVAPEVPRSLVGDPVRLAQVLINLVGNAIKFTERGGVDFRVERLSGGSDRAVLRFSVRDSGIGIAAEVLPRLFQTFVQADASVSRRYGGSGLGLAISERLVGMMGGRIEVESVPGSGSCFSFVLSFPLAVVTANEGGVEAIVDTAVLAGRRMLVAEDNRVNQEVLREYLERVGVQVVCVDDGRAAVQRLLGATEMPFDAVLMDVQMPAMDGVEATRCLRADARTALLPIVAVTANALREERQRFLAAGMNACVTKPYDPETLYRVLIALLSRRDDRAAPPLPALAARVADFDDQALGRLTSDAAARRRLAELYLESVVAAETELAAATAAGDGARLAGLCHRLQSSSLMLGAHALGQALAAMEAQARGGDAAGAFARADALSRQIKATEAWVRRLIENENQGEKT